MRLEHDIYRPTPVTIDVDGGPVAAYPGESVAVALLAVGRRAFRTTALGEPRGPFCNMGVCFECVVEVDGEVGVRACMTPVREGMRVGTR